MSGDGRAGGRAEEGGERDQPNGVGLWGLGSMRAARHGHVGRASSGDGTATGAEAVRN